MKYMGPACVGARGLERVGHLLLWAGSKDRVAAMDKVDFWVC